jgi:hypothetical protein
VTYWSWFVGVSRIEPCGRPVAGLGWASFSDAAPKIADQPPYRAGSQITATRITM